MPADQEMANGTYKTWRRHADRLQRLLGPEVIVRVCDGGPADDDDDDPKWAGRDYYFLMADTEQLTCEEFKRRLNAVGFDDGDLCGLWPEQEGEFGCDVAPATSSQWMSRVLTAAEQVQVA